MSKATIKWYADKYGVRGPLSSVTLRLADLEDGSKELLLIDYVYNYEKLEAYAKELEGRIYELEEHIDGAG